MKSCEAAVSSRVGEGRDGGYHPGTFWLDDPCFQTPAGRVKYADARLELTAEVLMTRTSVKWLARLEAAEVPCAPIFPAR